MPVQVEGVAGPGSGVVVPATLATPPFTCTLALLTLATPADAACGVTLSVNVPVPLGAIPPVTLTVQLTSKPAANVPEVVQPVTLVTPAPAAALLKAILGGS